MFVLNILMGIVTVCALALTSHSAHARDKFVRIGTGSPAGTYYAFGKSIASVISKPEESSEASCDEGGSCGVPGLLGLVHASQGSVQNVRAIEQKVYDLALAQADVSYWAFSGTGMYEGQTPFTHLRAIGYMYPEAMHVIVRAESSINTLPDIVGRRIALGALQSGTLVNARQLLLRHNILDSSLIANYMVPDHAIDALMDGKLDGIFLMAGAPSPAVDFLVKHSAIRFLPISDVYGDNFISQNGFYDPFRIPFATYGDMDSVQSYAVGALLLVGTHLEPDMVYNITKALWHPRNYPTLSRVLPDAATLSTIDAVNHVTVPFHEGALRYYREAGIIEE